MPADPDVVPRLSTTALPLKKINIARRKRRIRNRRMPPPASFNFEALADGQFLTERETGAVIRRSLATLEYWRKDPRHGLRSKRGGRIVYTAGAVREFLRTGEGK